MVERWLRGSSSEVKKGGESGSSDREGMTARNVHPRLEFVRRTFWENQAHLPLLNSSLDLFMLSTNLIWQFG
jgi:hypothetical protein